MKSTDNIIIGINPVKELLRGNRSIDKIVISNDTNAKSLNQIIKIAKEKSVVIKKADKRKLSELAGGGNHQGVIAYLSQISYSSIEDIFKKAESKGEDPFIIVADCIEDPHNLGAIIRSAECAGVHGVIIPKRHGAGITPTVSKVSAGAVEYVPVVRVTNLSATVDKLKDMGVWVYCADMDGKDRCEVDFSGGVALIIGNEGKGVSRILKEKSDFTVSLPLKGKINSLNASVAAGVLMFEVVRQRENTAKKGVE